MAVEFDSGSCQGVEMGCPHLGVMVADACPTEIVGQQKHDVRSVAEMLLLMVASKTKTRFRGVFAAIVFDHSLHGKRWW